MPPWTMRAWFHVRPAGDTKVGSLRVWGDGKGPGATGQELGCSVFNQIQSLIFGLNAEFLLTFCWNKNSVQLVSRVRLFVAPWTAACQDSLSITNSWSPPKPRSIESLMPSSHLILCRPLLLLPSIFPSIRVFSNESALCIRWIKINRGLFHC